MLIIFFSFVILSCSLNISNPTDDDFSGTEIYGDLVNLHLNDGSSVQIEVDFHNKKGIYGSGKGYDWEAIQKITIEDNRGSATKYDGNVAVRILMSPLIAAGVIFAIIYGGIVCSLSDCTK